MLLVFIPLLSVDMGDFYLQIVLYIVKKYNIPNFLGAKNGMRLVMWFMGRASAVKQFLKEFQHGLVVNSKRLYRVFARKVLLQADE